MNVTERPFSLPQKIFIVKSFYRHNENLTRVRFEFFKKFQIKSPDSVFRSLNEVLKAFESTGSVTVEVRFDVLDEDCNSTTRAIPETEVVTFEDEDLSSGPEPEETIGAKERVIPEKPLEVPNPVPSTSTTPKKGGDFRCHFCSKSCQSNASLITHIRTHTNERPFECSFCEKRFKQKGALKVHLRRHTGESPFVCGFCAKGFKQNVNLQQHLKNIHSRSLDDLKKKPR